MKMTMTAAGDVILHRGLPEGNYPGFDKIQAYINRGQARIGNLETTVTNLDTYCGAHSGGMWHTTTVRTLKQIESFGFNLMGMANNHALDFGPDGLLETLENVRENTDITLAGAGACLQEASDAVFRDLPAGRVAFISVCSSFSDEARAGHPTGLIPGRPGLNPLRFVQHFTVTKEHFETLKEIAATTYMNGQKDHSRANGFAPPLPEGTIDFGGLSIRLTENGKEEKINHPHPLDMERVLQAIEDAKLLADYVVVMVHSHQIEKDLMCYPDHFIREFAHKVIDAGVCAVIGGGTHEFKPVELYKGKPIFHSLGNFCFQLDTMHRQPDDMRQEDNFFHHSDAMTLANRFQGWTNGLWVQRPCFQSVIPYMEFENGEMTHLELQPIQLGFDGPRHLKGLPICTETEETAWICNRLNELSDGYGAHFTEKNGVLVLD